MTRVLSGHFSLQEYGTYSQVLLLSTTISSMTTLGLMDGINFFFCRENDEKKREAYLSTIFFLHYLISSVVSLTVLACTVPIVKYFKNTELKPLMIFAVVLPILTVSIALLQVVFIAIGKAKVIAIKNLLVSVIKLFALVLACYVFDNIAVILLSQVLMDVLQVVYFFVVLRNKNCKINILRFDKTLIKEILIYCIPMAMFAVIKSLNRDSDKFVISFFTDTETLAVYTNASKLLPFDIVMTSFCMVLLPYITRYIANKKYEKTQALYKSFLELSYIATTILAMGAVCVAPELMRFLYTEKYASYDFGVYVFIIYILVDVLSVLNITIILSAAGKTKTILFASLGTFFANIFLNIGSFFVFKEVGPALATLLVTLVQGIVILSLGAREIKTNILKLFDKKYLLFFLLQTAGCFLLVSLLRNFAVQKGLPYLVILFGGYGIFVGTLFLFNGKRLLKNLRTINKSKIE